MSAALIESLQLAFVAMGIVFVVLYALSLLMAALPRLVGREKPVKTAQPLAEPKTAKAETALKDGNVIPVQTIAVIASALAVYLDQSPQDLNIIAIRRTSSGLSPWTLNVRRQSVQN